ncbi:hypothetical protein B0H19DRAFT_1258466 [Mycena capillaripes]|nr:hypothetical protein B0H19DRAFT_1258466 [Mycena capillaripes]
MPRVPNELIEVIVREVGDIASLKTCPLVASNFRSPCQRILLCSLTLWTRLFLYESPHVAAYITALSIWLPTTKTITSEVESFVQILDWLGNVRCCAILAHLYCDRKDVPARVSSVIFRFLSYQPLRDLQVAAIKNISVSAVCPLLGPGPDDPFAITPHTSNPPWLIIRYQSDSISQLLGRPQSAGHTNTLRQLEIYVQSDEYVHTHALLDSAGHTLERIKFHCNTPLRLSVLSPPSLPALREVEFSIEATHSTSPWFKDTILTPRATLVIPSLPLEHSLMTALDHALIAHPASPSIRWRTSGAGFSDFGPWMQGMMAKVHEKGRLVVELL